MHHFGVSFVSSPGCFLWGHQPIFFFPHSPFSFSHAAPPGGQQPEFAKEGKFIPAEKNDPFQKTPNEQTEPALRSLVFLWCVMVFLCWGGREYGDQNIVHQLGKL